MVGRWQCPHEEIPMCAWESGFLGPVCSWAQVELHGPHFGHVRIVLSISCLSTRTGTHMVHLLWIFRLLLRSRGWMQSRGQMMGCPFKFRVARAHTVSREGFLEEWMGW